MLKKLIYCCEKILFNLFCIFPMQNKVVATTMRGRKYGDNPQYILEALHRMDPQLDLVWLVDKRYNVNLPSWVRPVYYNNVIALLYEMATSKIYINSHVYGMGWHKRKGQLVVETYHGGLGIKKITFDVAYVRENPSFVKSIINTCKISDVFISQSEHLSNLYRRAFGYKGPIYKCGYPKNDKLLKNCPEIPVDVRRYFGISENDKIVLYAPTFRDSFEKNGEMDFSVYGIDFARMKSAFEKKFGGTWTVMVKWHPILANYVKDRDVGLCKGYLDATQYNDMQDLIIASDAVVSDYSSCIFDAALREIPCFTFATDFEEYKKDRGVYYEMDELPFPYAQNNDELEANILNFDQEGYSSKWAAFKERTGLFESGHAALDIALKIDEFIKTGKVSWTLDS